MIINKKPTMLMILDGFGLASANAGNAIEKADKPNIDALFAKYPHTTLSACGEAVGLPDGQMGNSEVGHMNIGAGRIVYQDLLRISNAVKDGSFFKNAALISAMEHVKNNNTALHLLGLVSDGGVHSHIDHLKALIKMAKDYGIEKVYIHAFLDGRDVPPRCAGKYLSELEEFTTEIGTGRIVTVSGRYYAMDRDKRYERLQKAYDAMTLRDGVAAFDAMSAVELAYERGENDEFVTPTCVSPDTTSNGDFAVKDGDGMIMFNFRPDRAREITRTFVDPDFDGFERRVLSKGIKYVCMTQYDETMPNVSLAYPPEHLTNTLGEYISSLGLKQLRIAETEKYAHVTFFFNGRDEVPYKNEDRILIPSPKVATYDMQPEMSAYEVTDKVIEQINKDEYDCIILNFANADMVGHTGVMEAAVKAIEALNQCVDRVVRAVLAKGGQLLLTADHGNADVMLDENGNVVTAHSLNPVPLIHISDEARELKDGGKLCDIAPTLLELMGIPVPAEMTGISLLK